MSYPAGVTTRDIPGYEQTDYDRWLKPREQELVEEFIELKKKSFLMLWKDHLLDGDREMRTLKDDFELYCLQAYEGRNG